MPVEVIEYTLPEADQSCSQCGKALHIMSKEVRKELTIIPAKVKVNPQAYLEYIFQQIQRGKDTEVAKLLPWAQGIPPTL